MTDRRLQRARVKQSYSDKKQADNNDAQPHGVKGVTLIALNSAALLPRPLSQVLKRFVVNFDYNYSRVKCFWRKKNI